MCKLSLSAFINSFKESCGNNERFCFILGSGASVESDIPTGVKLAEHWISELNDDCTESELKELMQELNITDISISSENYFNIYNLRFYPEYKNGHAYIEKIMENKTPSYGYYPLSMQLINERNNLVITTNFDNLVEDALFIYTEKHPIVVNHESLSEYININSKRPMIAKIHRGMFFKPFNRDEELEGFEKWKEVLKTVFKVYTPIIIGYAGGDNSLMKFLKDETVALNGLYWCHYKGDGITPSSEILQLIKDKKGYWIPIDGFNSFMYNISLKLDYKDPSNLILETAKERVKSYQDEYSKFTKPIKSIINPDADQTQLKELIKRTENKEMQELYNLINENKENENTYIRLCNLLYDNNEYKETINILNKGLSKYSDNDALYRWRGFVYNELTQYDKALNDLNKAIELDQNYAGAYGNRGYAYNELKQYDKAINDLNKAIEIDPNYTIAYTNRGFSYTNLKQYDKAINDLNKAIELNPNYTVAYGNRGFTYNELKQYDKAINDLNKALELDLNISNTYNNRGFAYNMLKKYDKAINDLNKAIKLNPRNAEAYLNRSKTYNALGENEKAEADLKIAESLDSSILSSVN